MKMFVCTHQGNLGRLAVLACALMFRSISIHAATSVSQFGITWSWREDASVGQFANGDWWVVGPVTITNITNADGSNAANTSGTMANPNMYNSDGNALQGFDYRIFDVIYTATNNIMNYLPWVATNGSSLCSAISFATNAIGNGPQLETIGVLTVVASPPPPGSFRPPYYGTDKTIVGNSNSMDFSRLMSLPPPLSAPSLATVTAYFARPFIQINPTWTSGRVQPILNNPSYGREIAHQTEAGGLSLHLNYTIPQKMPLAVGMVQWGIDIYGFVKSGGFFVDDQGHENGAKLPMLLAGLLLNNANILSYCDGTTRGSLFSEDRQTWYVGAIDVSTPRLITALDNAWYSAPYTSDMISTPEWGGKHIQTPGSEGSQWNMIYRDVCGTGFPGTSLAVRLMGATSVWNHPAFFDYCDRYFSIAGGNYSTGVNDIQPFPHDMWVAYRNSGTNSGTSKQTPAPSVSPSGRAFIGPVQVTIASSTPGSTIYFTTDGSAPTTTSAQYTAPFFLTNSATVQAIAIASGMTISTVAGANYSIGDFLSADSWQNVALPAQTGSFTVSFDMSPSANGIDGVTGLSAQPAGAYTDLAAIVRFSSAGVIDARNGDVYEALNPLVYAPNVTYHVEMAVNLPSGVYSVKVTPQGGGPVLIASNYAFRTELASVAQLNYLAFYTFGGAHSVRNVQIVPNLTPTADPPLIQAGTLMSINPIDVSISNTVPGAAIYYTLDGTRPTSASAVYSAPFTLTNNATVYAFAGLSGYSDSPVAGAAFQVNDFKSSESWQQVQTPTNTGAFKVSWDMEAYGTNIDAITGLSGTNDVTGYADLAISVRFSPTGQIDARNGADYQADGVLNYTTGVVYHVSVSANVRNHSYSIVVTPQGASPVVIGSNYAFRSEQALVSQLNSLAFYAVGGAHGVRNVRFNTNLDPPSGFRVVSGG